MSGQLNNVNHNAGGAHLDQICDKKGQLLSCPGTRPAATARPPRNVSLAPRVEPHLSMGVGNSY